MMRALVALCVRHSGAVTALTVLALLLGSWGALHSPLDVFPEFVPTQVDVQRLNRSRSWSRSPSRTP